MHNPALTGFPQQVAATRYCWRGLRRAKAPGSAAAVFVTLLLILVVWLPGSRGFYWRLGTRASAVTGPSG